jgi:hypothetical protein
MTDEHSYIIINTKKEYDDCIEKLMCETINDKFGTDLYMGISREEIVTNLMSKNLDISKFNIVTNHTTTVYTYEYTNLLFKVECFEYIKTVYKVWR